MLILQFRFDKLFGMPIKQLSPVEQTCTFLVHHPYSNIIKIVNNSDNIPICLRIVHHESFEARCIPLFEHYLVELCPHYLFCFCVFRLQVINYNGHDFIIARIINMTSHRCPTKDLFYKIKRDP